MAWKGGLHLNMVSSCTYEHIEKKCRYYKSIFSFLEYFNWCLQKSLIFDISYPGVGGYCNNRSEIEFGCLCPYGDFRRGGWCYDKTHNNNQYDMAIQHNEDLTNY